LVRTRQGAHRASRSVAGAILPSLLAVVAVTALVTALYVWRGQEAQLEAPAAAPAGAEPSVAAAPSSPTTGASAQSSPQPGTASPSATRAATPTTSTSAAPPPATSAPAAADTPVVVLNQTARAGLASRVAERLRGQGWTVAGTGNFRGSVPATTVYYPPGAEAAAQALAQTLPTGPRVRPRFGNLSTTRLTVVVTDDYPS
jgi:cytoskeletal protein RodZ